MRALCWFVLFCLMVTGFLVSPRPGAADEVIDRVVAFVGDHAITLAELDAEYKRRVDAGLDTTREAVLATMINRFLLLREARRMRIDAPDDDTLVREYIELKVRAFVKVRENEVQAYYAEHREEFGNVPYEKVKDTIKTLLKEREVNRLLRAHIEKLREAAYIKVLL
ncbi:MAG: SurA N-terminal domain-containing protein [Nitrospirota bacterium]|jgi:hypothetical protein